MTDSNNSLPRMEQCYGILPSMLRKFDRYARRDSFRGDTRGEFEQWRSETRSLLHGLLGLDKMEDCGLSPVLEDVLLLPGGIRREHISCLLYTSKGAASFAKAKAVLVSQAGRSQRRCRRF